MFSSSISFPNLSKKDMDVISDVAAKFAHTISTNLFECYFVASGLSLPTVFINDRFNLGLQLLIQFDVPQQQLILKVKITGPGVSELNIFLGTLLRQILTDLKQNYFHLILTQEEKIFTDTYKYNVQNGEKGFVESIKDEAVKKQFIDLFNKLNITLPVKY